jgi:hypothetical protein
MDCKVPVMAFCKWDIREGHNPLLPNYMGNIGQKPVYVMDGPLEAMDDIMIDT